MHKIEKLVETFDELNEVGEAELKEIGSIGALLVADRGEAYAVGVEVTNGPAATKLLGLLLEAVRDRAMPELDLAEFGWRIGHAQTTLRTLQDGLFEQMEDK